MRHLKRNQKFGRKGDHRNAMLANLASSVIKHKRITTTLPKAKALRPVVEKLITMGRQAIGAPKAQNVHLRRLAAARLRQQPRSLFRGTPSQKGKVARAAWRESDDLIHILFDRIAPVFKSRNGGYTRIVKLANRVGDASPMAIIELVEAVETPETVVAEPAAKPETKPS